MSRSAYTGGIEDLNARLYQVFIVLFSGRNAINSPSFLSLGLHTLKASAVFPSVPYGCPLSLRFSHSKLVCATLVRVHLCLLMLSDGAGELTTRAG